MRRTRGFSRRKFKRKEIIYTVTAICFILGIISGVVKANVLTADTFKSISNNLTVYISNLSTLNFDKSQIFAECLVKYGKILLIIWFLGFIPPTAFISLLLIFAKGMSLGFTTGLLVRKLGFTGFFYACILYLPQNAVLVFAYFFASYNCLNIAVDYIKNAKSGNRRRKTAEQPDGVRINFSRITESGVSVMVGLACIVLASMIETYAVPWLAATFIG